MPDSRRLWRFAGLSVLALTLWRVVWLAASQAELGVDEAQYWLWSRSLDWGYYSKPPVIAWIIRATTDLLGSDGPFAVRLAAPLLHGATAALVMRFAWDLTSDRRTGAVAGLIYLLMPAVMIGSMTMSTDTPMLFCLALTLVLRVQVARGPRQPLPWRAAALGLAIGMGVMAKYAMVFLLPGLALAGLLVAPWRLAKRDAIVVAAVAALVVAPNLGWNLSHGFATLHHLADSANWTGFRLHPGSGASFLASQFAVFGPVIFAVMLIGSGQALFRRRTGIRRGLVLLTVPVLVVVTGQALVSHAYANWAVGAAVGGSVLVAQMLARWPRLLALSLVAHAVLALALPLLPALAIDLRLPNGEALFKRYTGRADSAHFALDLARLRGMAAIVAGDRGVLADLFYHVAADGPAIFAAPAPGRPANHYAMTYPLPDAMAGQVLYLTDAAAADRLRATAPEAREIGRFTPSSGWAKGRSLVALSIPTARLHAAASASGTVPNPAAPKPAAHQTRSTDDSGPAS